MCRMPRTKTSGGARADMNIREAKEILVPLWARDADGRPLSPGFCDEDLIAIAGEIVELRLDAQAVWELGRRAVAEFIALGAGRVGTEVGSMKVHNGN